MVSPPQLLSYEEQRQFVSRKTCRVAHAECNRHKNRYGNVVPCLRLFCWKHAFCLAPLTRNKQQTDDDTRVALRPYAGEDGSDYINASHIDGDGEGAERAYVATQGPLAQTVGDFWRMVWELGCTLVVMLGREREKEKVKVDRYWPVGVGDEETHRCMRVRLRAVDVCEGGEIVVRTIEIEPIPEYAPRGMLPAAAEAAAATAAEGLAVAPRVVHHFQYCGWPDHGAPTSTKHIRALLQMVDQHGPQPSAHSPMVVHCSAGIGRTGAFCAIHMALSRIRELKAKGLPPDVNLYRAVLRMRRSRAGMVQQLEQYTFCYWVIHDEIADKLAADRTPRHIAKSHPARRLSLVQSELPLTLTITPPPQEEVGATSPLLLPHSAGVPIPGRGLQLSSLVPCSMDLPESDLGTSHSYEDPGLSKRSVFVDSNESDVEVDSDGTTVINETPTGSHVPMDTTTDTLLTATSAVAAAAARATVASASAATTTLSAAPSLESSGSSMGDVVFFGGDEEEDDDFGEDSGRPEPMASMLQEDRSGLQSKRRALLLRTSAPLHRTARAPLREQSQPAARSLSPPQCPPPRRLQPLSSAAGNSGLQLRLSFSPPTPPLESAAEFEGQPSQ